MAFLTPNINNDRTAFYLEDEVETPSGAEYKEDVFGTGKEYPYMEYSSPPKGGAGWAAETLGIPADLATSVINAPGQAVGAAKEWWKGFPGTTEPPYQITNPVGGRAWWGERLGEPRSESVTPQRGLITQAEAKPISVAEAQSRGQKTFWVGDQEKLAVTAEQLAEFKKSDAYDPNSGKSALSQWSSAWSGPEVAPEAAQAPRRDVRDILIEEEGMELTPYDDPGGGRRTVGVGHQLGAGEKEKDVNEAEARDMLEQDISEAYDAVDRLSEQFDVGEIPSELRDELMMMAFQMGATGLGKFKKMWAAMKNQDWGEMVVQMGDSRWAKSQTPARAERTINRVKELFGV